MINKKHESPLRGRIAVVKLVFGLGLIAFGAAVIGFYYFSMQTPAAQTGQGEPRIWPLLAMLVVFLGGWAMIIAGSAMIYTAPMEICSACDRKLAHFIARFPAPLFEDIVRWINDTTPKALTSLRMAASPAPADENAAGIEIHACPSCRKNGWLAVCKLKMRAGKWIFVCQGEILSKPADIMEQLVRIAETRNAP